MITGAFLRASRRGISALLKDMFVLWNVPFSFRFEKLSEGFFIFFITFFEKVEQFENKKKINQAASSRLSFSFKCIVTIKVSVNTSPSVHITRRLREPVSSFSSSRCDHDFSFSRSHGSCIHRLSEYSIFFLFAMTNHETLNLPYLSYTGLIHLFFLPFRTAASSIGFLS